jgi:D-alanyl-D-alanine dipeptidase
VSAAGHPSVAARRIFTYAELAAIPPGSSDERLVPVTSYDPAILERTPRSGLVVRDTVARMLAVANAALGEKRARLKVAEGHRPARIQERYFAEAWDMMRARHPELSDEQLREAVHALSAVPDVAGHPTGGAVDVTAARPDGADLDMGAALGDFDDLTRVPTYAPGLSAEQERNRALLHDAMVTAGFAPFYGEWWHFCYGDREWAAFYGQPVALYGPR